MKLISWNLAHRVDPWRRVLDSGADVALLQEAAEPPSDVRSKIEVDDEPWRTEGAGVARRWRTAVVKLTDGVQVRWLKPRSIEVAAAGDLPVSLRGTLAAAVVTAPNGSTLTVASMYSVWERPHPETRSGWIYSDASAHRVVSDLAMLIGQQYGHRLLAAGDLNLLYGYGENGNAYWSARYATVFARMAAMGVPFVGPQSPNGRSADPWPAELPLESRNVPTYHSTHMTPAQATRQLDFVFASTDLVSRVRVTALNEPGEWGPSDHCRILIEIGDAEDAARVAGGSPFG